ncbi:MAG: type II toxin-antitoxin system HicA family toxin [Patescibacteria group bacterium]
MPKPLNRRELIRKLRRVGLSGPFSGAKHHYMLHEKMKIFIPNPHTGDIGSKIIKRIMSDIGISENKWNQL